MRFGIITDDLGNNGGDGAKTDTDTVAITVIPVPLATVERVTINGGDSQRSMVDSITILFSTVVEIDPGAIEVIGPGGTAVGIQVISIPRKGFQTEILITFTGPGIIAGSLADGDYTLILHADRIHDYLARALDGDGDDTEGGDRVDQFFRLFGDSDGDGDVDREDSDRFRNAFMSEDTDPSYLWYFDYDGDGDVDGQDNGQLRRRFGQSEKPHDSWQYWPY